MELLGYRYRSPDSANVGKVLIGKFWAGWTRVLLFLLVVHTKSGTDAGSLVLRGRKVRRLEELKYKSSRDQIILSGKAQWQASWGVIRRGPLAGATAPLRDKKAVSGLTTYLEVKEKDDKQPQLRSRNQDMQAVAPSEELKNKNKGEAEGGGKQATVTTRWGGGKT